MNIAEVEDYLDSDDRRYFRRAFRAEVKKFFRLIWHCPVDPAEQKRAKADPATKAAAEKEAVAAFEREINEFLNRKMLDPEDVLVCPRIGVSWAVAHMILEKRARGGKKARRCKACNKREQASPYGFTNIAPHLGVCTDCLNKAMARS